MVKQPKTVTPTDGKVAMPASGQALVSQERGRCNMAFLRSHQAKPLANREPTRSRGPQNSRQEDLNWDRLCASTARTPACWGHVFGGSMSQAAVPQRAWPAPAHQGALAQGFSSLYWPGSREQRQKQTPARHHQRRAGSFFPVLPSAWHLMDLKNPRGKSHSMGRGMARNLPPIWHRGPSGSGSTGWGPRGPGDKHWGGLWGHPGVGAGGHACVPLHPQRCCFVATATLSGLRCSIAQHRAGTGRRGAPHSPLLPPTQPRDSRETPPGCPHHPSPRQQQPHACLCLAPGRRGVHTHQPVLLQTHPASRTGGGLARGGVHRPWK